MTLRSATKASEINDALNIGKVKKFMNRVRFRLMLFTFYIMPNDWARKVSQRLCGSMAGGHIAAPWFQVPNEVLQIEPCMLCGATLQKRYWLDPDVGPMIDYRLGVVEALCREPKDIFLGKIKPLWYEARMGRLKVWWFNWHEGDIRFMGILCALMDGRHTWKDWLGRHCIVDTSKAQEEARMMVCWHCHEPFVLSSIKK